MAEAALGFPLFKAGADRLGWLFNMNTVCIQGSMTWLPCSAKYS